ncbi:MAG: hypothetical protein EBS05_11260 [Proteobacteria bacterium]|nr:hypothetical protein [Pseudomonadota bacterium]
MKRKSSVLLGLLCAALCLLSARPAVAQNAKPPTQLTYQGFLTDGNGVPFGNTAPVNKTVIFRIYDALTGGTIKWSSQQVVTVDKGYFSALLGQGSAVGSEPFNADLTGVFTGSSTVSDRYLELNADGTTIAPRLRFLPAPYALLAKSATELLDPITGANSLSISSGNLTVGGVLNVSTINSSGNLNVNNIGANGNITANGNILGFSLYAASSITAHGQQGAYLEWNKDGYNGMSYLLNQRGNGNGGIVFGEVSTANAITERMRLDGAGNLGIGTAAPGSKLDVNGNVNAASFSGGGASLTGLNASQISSGTLDNARTSATSGNTANAIVARDGSGNIAAGQVVANSFKIAGTSTLMLYSLARAPLGNPAAAGSGITLNTYNSDCAPRQGGVPANWYTSGSPYGGLNYAVTYVVPAGEVWEADYNCQYYWATDDNGGIVWTLDDVLTDDGVSGMVGLPQGPILFNQKFVLNPGTHVIRVKTIITGGSGGDHIYFPWHQPGHCMVRKYKSN